MCTHGRSVCAVWGQPRATRMGRRLLHGQGPEGRRDHGKTAPETSLILWPGRRMEGATVLFKYLKRARLHQRAGPLPGRLQISQRQRPCLIGLHHLSHSQHSSWHIEGLLHSVDAWMNALNKLNPNFFPLPSKSCVIQPCHLPPPVAPAVVHYTQASFLSLQHSPQGLCTFHSFGHQRSAPGSSPGHLLLITISSGFPQAPLPKI